jgi:hypothetical protein
MKAKDMLQSIRRWPAPEILGLAAVGLGLLALALLLSGCARPQSYVHPTADLSYITRVALAPMKNLTQEKGTEYKVMNVVATELLRRGLEVVEYGEVAKVLQGEGHGREDGGISKSVAENAGRRLNVQAFVTGAVHEYGFSQSGGNAYPEVTITLKLIDAKSLAILWEGNHTAKGTTVLDRLLGIDKKSPSDLCQEVVEELLDSLFGSRRKGL